MRIFRCCYAILRYQYLFTIPTLWTSKVSKCCEIITTYNFHSQAIFYLLEHQRMVKVLHFAPVFWPEQFHSSRQRQSWQDAELPLNSIPTSGNGGELPWQQLSFQRENLKSGTDQLIVRWIMDQTNVQQNEGACVLHWSEPNTCTSTNFWLFSSNTKT